MNKAQELIKKYNLSANSYYTKSPYGDGRDAELDKFCVEKEAILFRKYGDRIEKGWYGFSLGSPIPLVWFSVIDEFIEYILENNSVATILQQKLKFGGYRGYFSGLTEEESQMVDELEAVLFDKFLIY